MTPAPPLGAFPYGSCPEHELSLHHGDMLVLYTDGLVERPRVPLNDGIERLLKVLRSARSVEEACVRAFDAMLPAEGPRDDIAIVALRTEALPDELHLRLRARPSVLSEVRHVLRRWLSDRGASNEEIAEITIAASEACANAVEHAYPPSHEEFEVDARADDQEITITVRDTGSWRAPRDENRGRGLSIMNAAVRDVEIRRTDGGTEVVMHRRPGTEMTIADLQTSADGGIVTARLSGEIDMSNASDLMDAITKATPNGALGVALDLSEVDYFDSSGIRLLYRLAESLNARRQALRLVIPERSFVTDALRLAGVKDHIASVTTLEEAVRTLRAAAPADL